MSTKTLENASLKAVQTATGQRTIEFYLLAFGDPETGMPDKQGDIIAPTAADDWLASFYKNGRPLPISFTHAAVRNAEDPFNIIGYAPADPLHVYKDDHGIRVRAILDTETNEIARQVHSLASRGIIGDASVAYFTTPVGQKRRDDGATIITKIEDVLEGGPCMDGANDGAFVIAVKALTEKAVDNSPWDGAAAWRSCSSAADYRSICAGERSVGSPDERQHWALPHHQRPGAPPNAGGVRNALSRLPQTEGLTNAGAARSHLEAHMRSINPDYEAAADLSEATLKAVVFLDATFASLDLKAGRKISTANKAKLRAAQEVIAELLSLDEAEDVDEAATKSHEANAEDRESDNADEPGPETAAFIAELAKLNITA